MKVTRRQLRRLIMEALDTSVTGNHPAIIALEKLFNSAGLTEGDDYVNFFKHSSSDKIDPNASRGYEGLDADDLNLIYFALTSYAAKAAWGVFTDIDSEDMIEGGREADLETIRTRFDDDVIPHISGKYNLPLKTVNDPKVVSMCRGEKSWFDEYVESDSMGNDLLIIAHNNFYGK